MNLKLVPFLQFIENVKYTYYWKCIGVRVCSNLLKLSEV